MIRIVGEIAVAISSSLVLSVIVKATLVSAGALTMARIARRRRASIRHLVMATAFMVLLALPVMSVVISPRNVSVPTSHHAAIADLVVPSPPQTTAHAWQAVDNRGRLAALAIGSLLSPSTLAAVVWLTGVTLVLVPMGAGLIRVFLLRRSGLPWRHAQSVVDEVAAAQGVRRAIQLLLDEAVDGPMTCGVVRPAIILPRDARGWTSEEFQRAIVHEMEHIRRGDWLTMCVARVVCALYWFHPLVWLAWRRLRLEAERACDDAVLRSAQPEAYADQLVTLAERLASRRTDSVLAMANRGDLSARVAALLDGRQPRGRAGWLCIATASIAAVLLSIAVAPLRAVAVPQSSQSAPLGNAIFEVASVRDSSSLEQDGFFRFRAGQFQVTNQSLRWIIRWAYDLRDYQVIGLPGWADRQRFEIRATYSPASADAATVRTMLQRLLAERFAMRSHREQREIRLYQLVKANENGSLGPKLTASNVDCQTVAASPPAPSPNGERPRPTCVSFGGADQITAFTRTMADLAKALDEVVGSPVVDRTGLTGTWDYDLRWTLPARPSAEPNQQTIDSSAEVFTGLREQLGLKLEATRAPYDVLVVDAVSRPTSN